VLRGRRLPQAGGDRTMQAGRYMRLQAGCPFLLYGPYRRFLARHPESSIIATTEDLFPNATIRTIGLHSAEGRRMVKAYAPSSLPFYLFGPGAGAAINFSRIESGLKKNADGFSFKDGITPNNYFLDRVEKARFDRFLH